MASTRNLQSSILWAMSFLNYQPLTIGGMEPAMSNANIVMQTMLGAPFRWPWNRATTAIVCVAGQQDYVVALPTFGFIEQCTLLNAAGDDIKEIQVSTVLGASKEPGRPGFIATQLDDNAGNITFRFNLAPEQAYTATVTYQKKPLLMNSLVSLWSPIPDELAYIFDWGLLALSSILTNDEKWPLYNQKFISHLLGRQDGIDELQRSIFLGNWLDITKAAERAQLKTNQAIAARQQ